MSKQLCWGETGGRGVVGREGLKPAKQWKKVADSMKMEKSLGKVDMTSRVIEE